MCLSVWGPEPHAPPYTLFTCIQYTYSHIEEEGQVEPKRRIEGQQFSKSWVEITISIDFIFSL